MAFGATVSVAVDDGREVDVDLVGERGDPGQDVGELVLDLGTGALAYRLCEFAEFFAQPGDRRSDASVAVAVAIGALDHVLQLDEVHPVDRTVSRLVGSHDGHDRCMATHERAIVNPERSDAADELTDRVDIDTDRPEAADEIAERAADAVADDDVRVVAAVGGDGTQRTVAEAVSGTDTELAIVPGGTVNLLGRVHGVESVDVAAEAIERGEAHPFDLARCDGHAFLLNSSSGLDADMIAGTDDRAKRFGRVGYAAMGVLALLRAEPGHCTVTVDGDVVFDDDALTVMVMNVGQRGSANLTVAPDAATDDGLLDVVIARGSRRSYVRAGYACVRGRRPRTDDAVSGQGIEIEVRWDREVAVQCDGDPADRRDVIRYTVEPGAVALRT